MHPASVYDGGGQTFYDQQFLSHASYLAKLCPCSPQSYPQKLWNADFAITGCRQDNQPRESAFISFFVTGARPAPPALECFAEYCPDLAFV